MIKRVLFVVSIVAVVAASAVAVVPGTAAGTPPDVTIGVAGAAASTATYQGSAIAGTDDGAGLAGQRTATCTGPPACEQETVHLKMPAGYDTTHNVAITAAVQSLDPSSNLDVGIFDSTGAKLASNTAGSTPASVTAGNLKAGDYTVQVDGDVARGSTYTGRVTAVSVNTTLPNLSGGTTPIGFATPTPVDHFRTGYEPDMAQAADGKIYSSVPFGFSTTQSFVWRSDDKGLTFHPVEGNLAAKSFTCVGGGDTQLETDPVNSNLYFVDLQGLTNFSTSASADQGKTWNTTCKGVNGTGVDRQWTAIDSNGGTTAVSSDATGGRLYLDYDNAFQNAGSNQLVMNESLDGVYYGGLCTAIPAMGTQCPAPPAVISGNESLPGNILVDNVPGSQFQHSVYAIHTGSGQSDVIMSICRGPAGPKTAAVVAADCTDPTKTTVGDPNHVSTEWHDVTIRHSTGGVGTDFAVSAMDTAGNLYATWSEYAGGPGAINYSYSTDGGEHWSAPVTVSPSSLGNNVFPWITAGDPGRVAIAWYGAPQAIEHGTFGPDTLDHGTWNMYMAESIGGLTGGTWSAVKASDHQVKFGNISTQGLGGSPDRSLGDFMEITTGPHGEAEIVYVDDTSGDRNNDFSTGTGQSPPEAAGPVMFIKQNQGPSLFNSVGNLPTPPLNPINSITHVLGQGAFAAGGQSVAAPDHLNIGSVAVIWVPPATVRVVMATGDPHLNATPGPDPTLGGATNEWVVRWASPTPGGQGDGNIYYVGMESDGGGAFSWFDGSTGCLETTHCKYFTYQQDHNIPGHVSDNKITWDVPVADIGNAKAGDFLYSVQGFTATLPGPTVPVQATPIANRNDTSPIGNQVDVTPAFTAHLGSTTTLTPAQTPQSPFNLPGAGAGGSPNSSGIRPIGSPLAGFFLLIGIAGVAASRRRRATRL